jgi:hypothetical protein
MKEQQNGILYAQMTALGAGRKYHELYPTFYQLWRRTGKTNLASDVAMEHIDEYVTTSISTRNPLKGTPKELLEEFVE